MATPSATTSAEKMWATVSGPITRVFTRKNSSANLKRPAMTKYPAQDLAIVDATSSPPYEDPREDEEEDGLIELRGVHPLGGWWKTSGKGHGPRQIGRVAVVVSHQKAADSAEHLPDRECRRRGGEHRHERPAIGANGRIACEQAADEAAEPAHPPAIEDE